MIPLLAGSPPEPLPFEPPAEAPWPPLAAPPESTTPELDRAVLSVEELPLPVPIVSATEERRIIHEI